MGLREDGCPNANDLYESREYVYEDDVDRFYPDADDEAELNDYGVGYEDDSYPHEDDVDEHQEQNDFARDDYRFRT